MLSQHSPLSIDVPFLRTEASDLSIPSWLVLGYFMNISRLLKDCESHTGG